MRPTCQVTVSTLTPPPGRGSTWGDLNYSDDTMAGPPRVLNQNLCGRAQGSSQATAGLTAPPELGGGTERRVGALPCWAERTWLQRPQLLWERGSKRATRCVWLEAGKHPGGTPQSLEEQGQGLCQREAQASAAWRLGSEQGFQKCP